MERSAGPEVVGRMITLSGLLAGFSFTALIELITLSDARMVVTLTIVFALVSSVLYMLALFSFIASTSIPLRNERALATSASFELGAFIIFWMATFGLLVSVSMAGWIHSTLVGVIGLVAALIAMAVLVALLVIRGKAL